MGLEEMEHHTFKKIGQGFTSHKLGLKSNPIYYLAHLFGNQLKLVQSQGTENSAQTVFKNNSHPHIEKHKGTKSRLHLGFKQCDGDLFLSSSAFGIGSVFTKALHIWSQDGYLDLCMVLC